VWSLEIDKSSMRACPLWEFLSRLKGRVLSERLATLHASASRRDRSDRALRKVMAGDFASLQAT
jgi:hypothetical protein